MTSKSGVWWTTSCSVRSLDTDIRYVWLSLCLSCCLCPSVCLSVCLCPCRRYVSSQCAVICNSYQISSTWHSPYLLTVQCQFKQICLYISANSGRLLHTRSVVTHTSLLLADWRWFLFESVLTRVRWLQTAVRQLWYSTDLLHIRRSMRTALHLLIWQLIWFGNFAICNLATINRDCVCW